MDEACVFCEIAAGAKSAAKVLESDALVAFLDRRPLFPGHCLLVPKRHCETLTDLPAEGVQPLFEAARRLCAAVETAMGAEGTFLAVNNRVSQSVPHLHVHIVPRRRKDGLKGFFWPRQQYRSDEEMEAARQAIERALARM